jgi:hypothetical protein
MPEVIPDDNAAGVNFSFPVTGLANSVGKVTISAYANNSTFIGDLVLTLKSGDSIVCLYRDLWCEASPGR